GSRRRNFHDSRSQGGHSVCDRQGRAWRSGTARRERARAHADDRRSGTAVRRSRDRARGAGAETLTPADVAAAIGAKVAGPGAGREISGFSIDTRTIAAGDLFLAICGDRFDGNAYVAEAVTKG